MCCDLKINKLFQFKDLDRHFGMPTKVACVIFCIGTNLCNCITFLALPTIPMYVLIGMSVLFGNLGIAAVHFESPMLIFIFCVFECFVPIAPGLIGCYLFPALITYNYTFDRVDPYSEWLSEQSFYLLLVCFICGNLGGLQASPLITAYRKLMFKLCGIVIEVDVEAAESSATTKKETDTTAEVV